MKRIIFVIPLLVMVLGLIACGGESGSKDKDKGLQIGFGKINSTPKEEVGLGGYADDDTRFNTDGMADYIYATCIAVKEGEETLLLFTVDLIAIAEERANELRAFVTEATGVPGEKIFFGASHCHSAPADSKNYRPYLSEKIIEAAKAAVADLAPATMSYTTTQAPGMTFVRHVKMDDGSYAGSNFGDFSKTIVDYASKPDEQMVLIKFDRGEEKKSVIMVNFQAHNDMAKNIGYNMLAPGWVGPFRDEIAKQTDCDVAFFMGASGNLNVDSRIQGDKHNLGWREYAQKLGGVACEALKDLKPVSGDGISTTTRITSGKINHEWDDRVSEARQVKDLVKTSGKDAGNALAKSFGFTSIYQANAIVSRSSMGETADLEQSAFRIHNLGFIVGSYEMFCENGMAVKEAGVADGYEAVFIITGNKNYIPTKAAFEYRSYEGDTCRFVPGIAETLQENFIEMLKAVK